MLAPSDGRSEEDVQARTVTGDVHRSDLGVMLPHEHLNTDARFLCTDKNRPDLAMDQIPLADLRQAPMAYVENLDMRDEVIAGAEVELFQAAGGRTLVDLTPSGVSRDPELLQRVSSRTGVLVIMGTGYYVEASHPPSLAAKTVEEIANEMVREINIGVDETGIRAGVIGEIGTGDPLLRGEERVVRGAGIAQLETGCPINVHFAAGGSQVHRVLDILVAEGIRDLSRVVVSHMDVAIDLVRDGEIASRGAMVEYDTFGHEQYPDSRGFQMPTDEVRAAAVASLVDAGHIGNLLLSHDVCFRHLWTRYGGHGYGNLLNRVAPMLRQAGVSELQQRQLMVDNPSRVFAFIPSNN